MLCRYDWANTLYRFSECLKLLDYNVTAYKGVNHKFKYPRQLTIHPVLNRQPEIHSYPIIMKSIEINEIFAPLIDKADVVHFGASTFFDTNNDYYEKKVVVQHGGSTYRLEPDKCNKIFNPIVNATIMQFPTLLNKGAKNEHLIYYPVDTDFIQPYFRTNNNKKIIVGHFPSFAAGKGTIEIVEVIKELKENNNIKNRFEYIGYKTISSQTLPWEQNLKRMSKCDVIIETLKPILRGKEFGEWGNTAIEAAALGKIVITNTHSRELYKKEYGEWFEPIIANTPEELRNKLLEIFELTDKEILEKQKATRAWVETKHGMKPTAERLYNKIYKYMEN